MKAQLEQLESGGRLRLEFDGPMATLWLDHSARRNAFSAQMMVDLEAIVEELECWKGAVLLLRGTDGHFCAGADLRLMQGLFSTVDGASWMSQWMSGLLGQMPGLRSLVSPSLRAPRWEEEPRLACSTDFRIHRRGARFQFVQVSRGVSPGWGGAGRLRTLVGHRTALRILSAGEPIDPDWGHRVGLCDWVLEDTASEAEIQELLAPILRHTPAAVRANKRALLASTEGYTGESELDCFLSTLSGARLSMGSKPSGGQP